MIIALIKVRINSSIGKRVRMIIIVTTTRLNTYFVYRNIDFISDRFTNKVAIRVKTSFAVSVIKLSW